MKNMNVLEMKRKGLAGEFRVMSELFLRGHNPAKSYLENGPDLILENGKRIEVKCANKKVNSKYGRPERVYFQYVFGFMRSGGYKGAKPTRQNLDGVDFIICWCIDDNVFYVIPRNAKSKNSWAIQMSDVSENAKHKYSKYRESWDLLKGGYNA